MLRTLLAAAAIAAMGAQASTVTFNKDVLPILQKNCQSCHRPGEIGPMSLLTYESARPWAKAIKTAVLLKEMPPWFADARWGHFANARMLSENEMQTISKWVDLGAPEGDAKDKLPAIAFVEGWQIKPDVIISMPHTLTVPPTGTVEYVNIKLPTGFNEDTWVSAVEVRPRDRSVVHHAAVFIRPPGSPWLKDAKYGEPYIQKPNLKRDTNGFEIKAASLTPPAVPATARTDDTQRGADNSEWLGAYIPGMQPWDFRLGNAAKLVPAGSDIVINLHFTPDGHEKQDAVDVGMVLAKEAPQRRYLTIEAAASTKMVIPAGDPSYEVQASLTFAKDVQLVWYQPHMHVRGKDMTYRALYPTGESQTLLSVPRYDFNWQIGYDAAEPIPMPKGTKILVTAHFDNSANNPHNPNPAVDVPWGDQSWEEMMAAFMGVIVDDHSVQPSMVALKGQRSVE